MSDIVPPRPPHSFRITLNLDRREKRLDSVLLKAMRDQNENPKLKEVSRTEFKELFNSGKILIKGQKATPSSALMTGVTYVDILGF